MLVWNLGNAQDGGPGRSSRGIDYEFQVCSGDIWSLTPSSLETGGIHWSLHVQQFDVAESSYLVVWGGHIILRYRCISSRVSSGRLVVPTSCFLMPKHSFVWGNPLICPFFWHLFMMSWAIGFRKAAALCTSEGFSWGSSS